MNYTKINDYGLVRGMTDCRKCELNDNCPGFADCPKMEQPMNKHESVIK